jgi:cysteine desulfurase / selenocysteine lyase
MQTPCSDAPWRAAFPALRQQVNGHALTYLDTAATALRPDAVIEAVADFSRHDNANPGAALHTLARRSHAALEQSRRHVAAFIGASDPLEVAFTRGTTEGINLVASSWGSANVRRGDELLVTLAEHASNLLPWRMLAERTGAIVRVVPVDAEGRLHPDEVARLLTPRTRVVAFSHVSNVLGMTVPAREICDIARAPGRLVVVDAAQSVPHLPVDVHALGCDVLAFSSHKMLGPMGVGVVWMRRELLDTMPPYQYGSNMAHDVDFERADLSPGALKFGAGTPNVSGPVGLAAAIGFLQGIGWPALQAHERRITERMLDALQRIPAVRLLGSHDASGRVGVFSFTVAGHTPLALVQALDASGIAIRAGDLAALPLLRHFGTTAAARASCYLYTSTDDVDRLEAALARRVGRC